MYRRSFAEQHPVILGLCVLFGVAFVIAYWPAVIAAGIAYGAVLGARTAVRCRRRRQWEDAAIAARADYEHTALMRARAGAGSGRWKDA
jgi:hypothetical protein